MKFLALAAAFIMGGGLVACSSEDSTSSGGEGGDTSTSSSKASTSAGQGGAGQGGAGQGGAGAGQGGAGQGGGASAGTCDDKKLPCQTMDGKPSCQTCSTSEGECVDEFAACGNFKDKTHPCVVLNDCYALCQMKPMAEQAPCAKKCDMDNPMGVAPLNAVLTCFVCKECPLSCPTQAKGCPP